MPFHHGALLVLLVAVTGRVAFADDQDEAEVERKHPFRIKLVDEARQPVAGAIAGVTAYFGGEGESLPVVDSTGWQYLFGAKSAADGIAALPDGAQADHLCVVVRHPDRKLIAIEKIDRARLDAKEPDTPVVVRMHPECRVFGRLANRELAAMNREMGWTSAYLNVEENFALECRSNKQEFHFFVPEGAFTIYPGGTYVHSIEKKITVKAGQRELDLGTIELPARPLAILQGKPAPELVGVAAWKNSSSVSLADLKGKCVILDFWGYWCGPCVHQMPDLFELYDKYHDQGLEIVGIHVDLGKAEKTPVDSAVELNERLAKIRKELWNGRDVPYPVALVVGKPSPYAANVFYEAKCQLSADYGITAYPTLVLIDRRGNIVDRFEPRLPKDIARLEALLQEKASGRAQ